MNPWAAFWLGVLSGGIAVPVLIFGTRLYGYFKSGQKGPGG